MATVSSVAVAAAVSQFCKGAPPRTFFNQQAGTTLLESTTRIERHKGTWEERWQKFKFKFHPLPPMAALQACLIFVYLTTPKRRLDFWQEMPSLLQSQH
ncbi:hypothetical protein L6164_019338 [Bauhinia variegata]|uniref:Uncharacterized protein n=1 Tax=Bauhinia variegata TaxID=167791 RepID=A0ACB9MT15_BAUVA|nr:hypothetical protein L6164_019338 [Bauhinia variegata]